jgi:hypothetical protein
MFGWFLLALLVVFSCWGAWKTGTLNTELEHNSDPADHLHL